MLNPQKDRIDYGEKLRPPSGFELSYALATSFTLDLDTLVCLPIALCFNNTLEGKLEGEKLALLEAIGQLDGRLKVFFQQGNIKTPHQFNRLFTLLESCLAPIVPATPFSSFHPKIWLLRFVSEKKEVLYRLVVLSRNLTFDRSWDLAVTLEGALGEGLNAESNGLLEMLNELKPNAPDFRDAFQCFDKELPKVFWKKPFGFTGLKTLPGNSNSVPLDFGGDTSSILVISPFLHSKALDWLQTRGAEHWLFSRAEELNRIGPEPLKGWTCYSLSENVVNGEDDLEDSYQQNLHAKLMLIQNGATSHWHVGSANGTIAALGDGRDKPRNTEFMVRLTGRGDDIGPKKVIEELAGTEEKPTGIFVKHVFSEIVESDEPLSDIDRRKLEHALIQGPWEVIAILSEDGSYQCDVSCVSAFNIPDGCCVEVGQLATNIFQAFQSSVTWRGLALNQVSAFIPLRVTFEGIAKPILELMVKGSLRMPGGDGRAQKIMNELIDSPEKFMAYIRLLLLSDVEKPEWFGIDVGKKRSPGDESIERLLDGPIFESLLRSAARQPEQLARIESLIQRLQASNATIPVAFSTLWAQFKKYTQGSRR